MRGRTVTRVSDNAAQLDRIVDLVREVLGSDALGAYLFGSIVAGGLRPRSDLDLLVVASRRLTPDERRAIITRLLPLSGRGDPSGRSRPVELTIVVQADVRPWRYPPRLELLYGDWLRPDFERGTFDPWESPNPDLALTITQVRAAHRALFGPPPAALLDAPPPEEVRRAMLDGIPGLLANLETDTANVVLTLARIWVTLSTARILPKDRAADWALARLGEEHRPSIQRAREVYLGAADDRWDSAAVRSAADRLVVEIRGLAGASERPGA